MSAEETVDRGEAIERLTVVEVKAGARNWSLCTWAESKGQFPTMASHSLLSALLFLFSLLCVHGNLNAYSFSVFRI